MEREAILEKSRQSGIDEGLEAEKQRLWSTGGLLIVVMALLLNFLSLAFHQSAASFAVSALFGTYLCIEGFVRYRSTSKRWYLAICIGGTVIAILELIGFALIIAGVF